MTRMMMRKRMEPSRPSWKYGCGSRMLTQDLYLNSCHPTSFQKLVRLPKSCHQLLQSSFLFVRMATQ